MTPLHYTRRHHPPFGGIMCDVCTTDFAVKKMYHKRAETIRNVFLIISTHKICNPLGFNQDFFSPLQFPNKVNGFQALQSIFGLVSLT